MYKYWDRVKIIGWFYEWLEGTLHNEIEKDKHYNVQIDFCWYIPVSVDEITKL